MKKKIIESINDNILKIVKDVLENDGVIILPTDTNYNLVCNATSDQAIKRIFTLKNRPPHKLLPLCFANSQDWKNYGFSENNIMVEKVINYFWPGPLNIILHNKNTLKNHLTNADNTIALGCSANSVWQQIVSYFGKPVVLTSANISGEASDGLVTKDIAWKHVGKEVDMFFVDNTPKKTTKSSTIIDFTKMNFSLVRSGDITIQEINAVIDND